MGWLSHFRRRPASSSEPGTLDEQLADVSSESPSKEEEQQIAQAITALVQASSWTDTYAYLEQHASLLLTDATLRYLDAVITARNAGGQFEQATEIGRYRALLADAHTRGIPAAWDTFLAEQQARQAAIAQRGPIVISWLSTQTYRDGRRFLEAHLELLQSSTDDVLARLIDQYHDQPQAVITLRQHLALLQEIRRRGGDIAAIRATYVNNNGGLALDVPEWLAGVELQSDELENQGAATAPARADLWRGALRRADGESLAPEILAAMQTSLYAALYFAPDHGAALEEGISALKSALPTLTHERYPLQWAIVQSNLGTAYSERTGGTTRAENVEEAIAALSAALAVLTTATAPIQWAQTQNTLGLVYRERALGNRAENFENAIACYTSALQVFTPTTFPLQWAQTQNNLGIISVDRVVGDHAANVEQAIANYQAALTVATREVYPAQWAQTQNNLGIAYKNRIEGDPAENMEMAIACYQAALMVRTREADPDNWAQTQNNLGKALAERIRGNHADNLEQAIVCLTGALEVRTRASAPTQWAITQYNLGHYLVERVQGDHADNVERAIACFTSALEVSTRDGSPGDWANLQDALGTAYAERVIGPPDDNLEQALARYTSALSVYSPEAFPLEWASTQNHLGLAYRERQHGDVAENTEQALACFVASGQIITREANPRDWSSLQINLGNAYLERIRGDRAENIEQAIAYYQAASQVRTRETVPLDWAATKLNLSGAYSERIRGDRAENVELAISACDAALTVYTREDAPLDWVMVMHNRASAYMERIQGSRSDNVEAAITMLQDALTVISRERAPSHWAMIQLTLGNALRGRVLGREADNIEDAIAAYTNALTIYTRDNLPVSWALAQNNLGNAYLDRIHGDRAANIEQGIAAYQAALEVRTREAMPLDWAAVQSNLGSAHSDRIRGDRSENQERAISHFTVALEVVTHDAVPDLWARTQHNLGTVYAVRLQGLTLDNIERALLCYEAALEVYTRESNPSAWAREVNALGDAFFRRITGDRGDNVERAIACYTQASDIYSRDAYPPEWALLQINLGRAYRERVHGDRGVNLDAALTYFQSAVEVYTRANYPLDWARVQINLADLYVDRLLPSQAENRAQAISFYRAALEIYNRDASPAAYRAALLGLAEAEASDGQWEAAAIDYASAIEAEDLLLALAAGPHARDAVAQGGREASTRAALVLTKLGRFEDAILAVERGRARSISESLALQSSDPERIGDIGRRERYVAARERLLQAQAALSQPWSEASSEDERRQMNLERLAGYRDANDAFSTIVSEIQAVGDPADFLRDSLNLGQIWQATHQGDAARSLMYVMATPWGGLALAALPGYAANGTSNRIASLELPNLTSDLVDALLQLELPERTGKIVGGFGHAQEGTGIRFLEYGWPGDTFADKASALHASCMAAGIESALDAAAQEILSYPAILDIAQRPFGPAEYAQLGPTLAHSYLERELKRCLVRLREVAFKPLVGWLREQGASGITLIPCGGLAAFPLLAVPISDDDAPSEWQTVGDAMPTSLAPSARSLHTSSTDRGRAGIYALGDPRPTHQELRWGEAEARTIVQLGGHPEQVATLENATRPWLLDALRNAEIIDISCHGEFNMYDFLASRLLLANHEELTLGDMLSGTADLHGLRLLILSACQTAILDLRGARDEVRSLAAGMLQAGAQAVVGALWPVDDKATYLLMVRFVQEWLPSMNNEPPAAALSRAQRWLRTVTNRELRQWEAMSIQTSDLGVQRDLVTVRGGGTRFGIAEAQERLIASAALQVDDACPYADPIFWSAFTITGW
jgi:CHAT domain-containing protein